MVTGGESVRNVRAGPLGLLYDSYAQRPCLMTVVGRAVWGIETAPLFRSIARLDAIEHVTILDVPCGGGVALRALKPGQDVRYIAADSCPKMIARAKRRAGRLSLDQVEFVCADMTRLPLRSGMADIVLCYSGLHMLADPSQALCEFARCLRPGGLLTGTTFLLDDLSARGRMLFESGGRRGHPLPPRREDLFCALAAAGFREATIGPQPGFAAFSAHAEV
jgi:SAM-dependent methyltransferase